MKTIGIASHYIRQHPGIRSVVASFEEKGACAGFISFAHVGNGVTATFHWTRLREHYTPNKNAIM